VLFRALTRHRPVGLDKHIHMISLLNAVNRALQNVDPDSLRSSLPPSPSSDDEVENETASSRGNQGKGRATKASKEDKVKIEGEEGGEDDGEMRLQVGSEEVWIKLRSMWDLDRLDELVSPVCFPLLSSPLAHLERADISESTFSIERSTLAAFPLSSRLQRARILPPLLPLIQ
jgi:hypothetical protein